MERTEPEASTRHEIFASLPPEWPEANLRQRIRQATLASRRKVVVLDDDPTGTQTVHDLPVLTDWAPAALSTTWAEAETTFYILTNSRRYPLEEAAAINQQIAGNVAQLGREQGVEPIVVSRSDSTLRGHYPGEVQALQQTLEDEFGMRYDGLVIAPFFLEGARYTIDDVHWVLSGQTMVPAAKTEFAQDATFGYGHSRLQEWVEEKTQGQVPAAAVISIGLPAIREGGPDAVTDLLLHSGNQQVIIVNAASYRDMEVFVWGLMQAEQQGRRYLFRTAASFVQVRGGILDRGLLTPEELWDIGEPEGAGGLTLVGSYVQRTTDQLNQALRLDGVVGLELRVAHVLDEKLRAQEIERARLQVEEALGQGHDVVLCTSRALFLPSDMAQLQAAQKVSAALVTVLGDLSVKPRYLIGKGGITSSDLATDALGVRKARVLGQIVPGVPVWRLGPESNYPGLPYVVFPGNVGGPDALASVIQILRRRDGLPA